MGLHPIIASLLMVVLLLTSLFLIIIVLIQRGKGGGLAGAFGGMGGQSAFGTKAGDLFTRVTIGLAAFWIILCIAMIKILGISSSPLTNLGAGLGETPAATAPATPGKLPPNGQAKEAPAPTAVAPANAPAKGEAK